MLRVSNLKLGIDEDISLLKKLILKKLKIKETNKIVIVLFVLQTFKRLIKETGIKSKTLIDIMTASEKDKQKHKNLLIFTFGIFKNISSDPRTVESPATVEMIIGYISVPPLYLKFMKKKTSKN